MFKILRLSATFVSCEMCKVSKIFTDNHPKCHTKHLYKFASVCSVGKCHNSEIADGEIHWTQDSNSFASDIEATLVNKTAFGSANTDKMEGRGKELGCD